MGFLNQIDSWLPFGAEHVGPAVDIAIERMALDYDIHYEKFTYFWPDFCNEDRAVGGLGQLYYFDHIEVAIGPACSQDVMVAGRLATFLGLPMLTGVGNLVNNKHLYPTVSRLSYDVEHDQTLFLTSVLEHFGWYHVAMIFDTSDFLTKFVGNAFRNALNSDARFRRPYDIYYSSKEESYDLEKMLLEASEHARAICILSSADHVREMLLHAHRHGMTHGDYVFIAIERFRSDIWGKALWKKGDDDDDDARYAYQSLMVITLADPVGPQWDEFTEKVKLRALRDYNYTWTKEVNYFIGGFYDAVLMHALSIRRIIAEDGDITDGLAVSQRLWNTTFQGG
ncbi:PREDICTED: atrial natriuretic peptide receptor 3-like [Priapulus caudatus]|uniref:Atrial natriuretic peptide receptor 3-like n=1 Tax=Priapulus caudatus TaxID=37621 RepID=A0ABM1DU08_PRICU|nr:PREDICTED: atrial natriuretic peptide receptor 3-like [Priapulus caudatus]